MESLKTSKAVGYWRLLRYTSRISAGSKLV